MSSFALSRSIPSHRGTFCGGILILMMLLGGLCPAAEPATLPQVNRVDAQPLLLLTKRLIERGSKESR